MVRRSVGSDAQLGGLQEGANQGALAEFGLVVVSAMGLRSGKGGVGGMAAAASSRARPFSAASASRARHGLVATPPRAMRASLTVPFARSSATAAEARANS